MQEYTVPYSRNHYDELDEYEQEEDNNEPETISKEEIREQFLNDFGQNEEIEERPRKRAKGKRFK